MFHIRALKLFIKPSQCLVIACEHIDVFTTITDLCVPKKENLQM